MKCSQRHQLHLLKKTTFNTIWLQRLQWRLLIFSIVKAVLLMSNIWWMSFHHFGNNRRWRFVPAIDDFQTYQTFSRKASSSGDGNQSMLKQKDMLNVDRICWSKRIPFDLESHQRFRYWDDKQKSVVWTFSSSKLL